MRGKLFWKQLKVVNISWINCISSGTIDIHIPIQLYIPYKQMDQQTPWLIREAIYKHLLKLRWPVEDINNIYFDYLETYYHFQIHTNLKSTVDFYAGLNAWLYAISSPPQ